MIYRTFGVLLILGLLIGCDGGNDSATGATPVAFNLVGAPTIEFTLPDMMCEDGCAMTVKDILGRQPGAKEVAVDFEGKKATVAIDESTFDSKQALAELVDKGFLESSLAGADRSTTPEAALAPRQVETPSSPSD